MEGRTKKVENFLSEIARVSLKHGLSIAHEDHQGSFEIEKYDNGNISWLFKATENLGGEK